MYHCSKNMFVLNFLVPETVIYYLLTLFVYPSTSFLFSLILELCLVYVGSSAFHLNELAAYLPGWNTPRQVLCKYESPAFCAIISKFPADKPLKNVLKLIGLISSCSHSCLQCISIIKGRLVLLNWTTKQVDFLLLIIHLSMIFVFHHRGHFYRMNTLHCLDDG